MLLRLVKLKKFDGVVVCEAEHTGIVIIIKVIYSYISIWCFAFLADDRVDIGISRVSVMKDILERGIPYSLIDCRRGEPD